MAFRLSHEEKERIQAAVAAGEARAGAHIAFVAIPASDRYALYPIVWAALIAFVAAGIAAFALVHVSFQQCFAGEAILFVLLSVIFEWHPLKLLLVPVRFKRGHAQAFAYGEFAARILASPERRGGVLLFVSLGERYAELLADREAHARVGQAAWDAILVDFVAAAKKGRLADAVVAAIAACSVALESHPPR
jgi:putative membrane protein